MAYAQIVWCLFCSYKFYATLLGSYTLTWSFIICNQIKSYFCLPRPEEGGYDAGNKKVKYEKCYDWSFPSLHVQHSERLYCRLLVLEIFDKFTVLFTVLHWRLYGLGALLSRI